METVIPMMTPQRFDELRAEAANDPRLNEALDEIARLTALAPTDHEKEIHDRLLYVVITARRATEGADGSMARLRGALADYDAAMAQGQGEKAEATQ